MIFLCLFLWNRTFIGVEIYFYGLRVVEHWPMPLLSAEKKLCHGGARLCLFDHLPQTSEETVLWILPVLCILQQNLEFDEVWNKTNVRAWWNTTKTSFNRFMFCDCNKLYINLSYFSGLQPKPPWPSLSTHRTTGLSSWPHKALKETPPDRSDTCKMLRKNVIRSSCSICFL